MSKSAGASAPSQAEHKATALAAKLDEKVSALHGYPSAFLQDSLKRLATRGEVEVGWRECCGSTHITMKIRREWIKVVKALRKAGIVVTEEPVKHKNGWATNNGGFWHSTVYRVDPFTLSPTPDD